MPERFTLVALLTLEPGAHAEFERFENEAARIMRRHGGRIERRIALSERGAGGPDELHLVTFPDRGSFERYRADEELRALSPLRARAVRETLVWEGTDAEPFGDAR
jgi:hypothetical protein